MDITAYRRAAVAAYSNLRSWRELQAHRPVTFHFVGFPTEVDSVMDLRPILDTMQEGVWDPFNREMGGLSRRDVADLIAALRSWREFAVTTFGIRDNRLPLDTMIAHLALYRKLCRFQFRDLLEIGPGCGYLSFFLAGHGGLGEYHQIENTETFYQLQHTVNRHCFGTRHYERALDNGLAAGPRRCEHWPWWRIKDVAEHEFDLVTSNANLTEMTDEARTDYLALIQRRLRKNGVIVVQCYGGGLTPRERVLEQIKAAGWVQVPQTYAGEPRHHNGVWVREGETPLPALRDMGDPRRYYSMDEIAAAVNVAA